MAIRGISVRRVDGRAYLTIDFSRLTPEEFQNLRGSDSHLMSHDHLTGDPVTIGQLSSYLRFQSPHHCFSSIASIRRNRRAIRHLYRNLIDPESRRHYPGLAGAVDALNRYRNNESAQTPVESWSLPPRDWNEGDGPLWLAFQGGFQPYFDHRGALGNLPGIDRQADQLQFDLDDLESDIASLMDANNDYQKYVVTRTSRDIGCLMITREIVQILLDYPDHDDSDYNDENRQNAERLVHDLDRLIQHAGDLLGKRPPGQLHASIGQRNRHAREIKQWLMNSGIRNRIERLVAYLRYASPGDADEERSYLLDRQYPRTLRGLYDRCAESISNAVCALLVSPETPWVLVNQVIPLLEYFSGGVTLNVRQEIEGMRLERHVRSGFLSALQDRQIVHRPEHRPLLALLEDYLSGFQTIASPLMNVLENGSSFLLSKALEEGVDAAGLFRAGRYAGLMFGAVERIAGLKQVDVIELLDATETRNLSDIHARLEGDFDWGRIDRAGGVMKVIGAVTFMVSVFRMKGSDPGDMDATILEWAGLFQGSAEHATAIAGMATRGFEGIYSSDVLVRQLFSVNHERVFSAAGKVLGAIGGMITICSAMYSYEEARVEGNDRKMFVARLEGISGMLVVGGALLCASVVGSPLGVFCEIAAGVLAIIAMVEEAGSSPQDVILEFFQNFNRGMRWRDRGGNLGPGFVEASALHAIRNAERREGLVAYDRLYGEFMQVLNGRISGQGFWRAREGSTAVPFLRLANLGLNVAQIRAVLQNTDTERDTERRLDAVQRLSRSDLRKR